MIGFFDSGIGGLTVVRELFKQLPGFNIVYLGDTARTPYGNKSVSTVRRYAIQDARFLVAKGARVIVVACNSASAVALEAVKQAVDVPVIGVVRPAVAAVIDQHQPKQVIGVIGTRATVGSGIYDRLLKAKLPQAKIRSQACPLFVPLVEEGVVREPETAMVAKRCLSSLRWPKVQTLILGCTHYPFLKSVIQKTVGPEVRLIDPAQATVSRLAQLIEEDPALRSQLLRRDRHRFYLTDRTGHYAELSARWLGRPVKLMTAQLN